MKFLLLLWSWITAPAPANPSGCGRGGMCLRCPNCPDHLCEGFPK